jgi:hypothetical protein
MPEFVGIWLNRLISSPLALSIAGAVAALIVVGIVLAFRRVNGRPLLPFVGLVLVALGLAALIDRFMEAEQAAERRALIERAAALDRSALQAGSALACLDAGAGEQVEEACEKAVFASPQTAAAAVTYMGARLQLLQDGAAFAKDIGVAATLTATRRAVALDRYGIAAQVLASRDGCTPAHCPAFTLVDDANALKANLKAQVFQQYVSRYAAAWNATGEKAQAPSAAPSAAPVAAAEPAKEPVKGATANHWDFPSAASIPPVSIMNAEPPLPKNGDAAPPAATVTMPLPPKRPVEAKPPPAR